MIAEDEAPSGASTGVARRRGWLFAAGGLLLVTAVAGGVLLKGSGVLAPRELSAGRGKPPARVSVAVRSPPLGATVLVDGRDSGLVTNGELVLEPPLPGQVVLTFRKPGHRDETRTVRLPPAGGEVVSVTLQVEASAVPVRTRPPGASVLVDGERVAGETPLDIRLDPQAEHTVELTLEGYEPRQLRLAAGEQPTALDVALERLPPPGAVAVVSEYPLDVFWRGRPLARGAVSPRVQVPVGRQVLTLVSSKHFLHEDVTVQVLAGGEVSLEAPGVGRLSVRANPDNCEVFFDGTFVDYPPILDRPVAAGRHTVAFRWPDGARSEQVVEVKRGAPAFAVGRKE